MKWNWAGLLRLSSGPWLTLTVTLTLTLTATLTLTLIGLGLPLGLTLNMIAWGGGGGPWARTGTAKRELHRTWGGVRVRDQGGASG